MNKVTPKELVELLSSGAPVDLLITEKPNGAARVLQSYELINITTTSLHCFMSPRRLIDLLIDRYQAAGEDMKVKLRMINIMYKIATTLHQQAEMRCLNVVCNKLIDLFQTGEKTPGAEKMTTMMIRRLRKISMASPTRLDLCYNTRIPPPSVLHTGDGPIREIDEVEVREMARQLCILNWSNFARLTTHQVCYFVRKRMRLVEDLVHQPLNSTDSIIFDHQPEEGEGHGEQDDGENEPTLAQKAGARRSRFRNLAKMIALFSGIALWVRGELMTDQSTNKLDYFVKLSIELKSYGNLEGLAAVWAGLMPFLHLLPAQDEKEVKEMALISTILIPVFARQGGEVAYNRFLQELNPPAIPSVLIVLSRIFKSIRYPDLDEAIDMTSMVELSNEITVLPMYCHISYNFAKVAPIQDFLKARIQAGWKSRQRMVMSLKHLCRARLLKHEASSGSVAQGSLPEELREFLSGCGHPSSSSSFHPLDLMWALGLAGSSDL